MSELIAKITLSIEEILPSYLALHLFFQRFQRIMMGIVSISNCWISLLLLWNHHFIRSILRDKSSVFSPVMPINFIHTALSKKTLLKMCSIDST